MSGGTQVIMSFYVTTKFLLWTHHIAISWTDPADSDAGGILANVLWQPGTPKVCPGRGKG
jgi:hypothetical protein